MEIYIFIIFVLGYVAITMEHSLKVDKLIPALLMMVACWTLIAFGADNLVNWIDPATGVKDGIIPTCSGVASGPGVSGPEAGVPDSGSVTGSPPGLVLRAGAPHGRGPDRARLRRGVLPW